MRILKIENSRKPDAVEITALLGIKELQQLLGELSEICVFFTGSITAKTSITMTGARHTHAKYFLFPAKLRREFKADEFDFSKVTCGAVRYREKLFVIYGVPRKI